MHVILIHCYYGSLLLCAWLFKSFYITGKEIFRIISCLLRGRQFQNNSGFMLLEEKLTSTHVYTMHFVHDTGQLLRKDEVPSLNPPILSITAMYS